MQNANVAVIREFDAADLTILIELPCTYENH